MRKWGLLWEWPIWNLSWRQHNICLSTANRGKHAVQRDKALFQLWWGERKTKETKHFFLWKLHQQHPLFQERPLFSNPWEGREAIHYHPGFLQETGEPECTPSADMKESHSPACLPIPSTWRNPTVPPILTLLWHRSYAVPEPCRALGLELPVNSALQNAPSLPESHKVSSLRKSPHISSVGMLVVPAVANITLQHD